MSEEVTQEKDYNPADVLYGDVPNPEEAEAVEEVVEGDADNKNQKESEEKNKAKDEPRKKRKKKEFVFNRDKYIEDGITDESVLKMLEEKDRELHKRNITIGKQGAENKRLEEISKELELIKDKAKGISDDEYNELALDNPAEARKRDEEARKAQEQERLLIMEHNIEVNKGILAKTESDTMEALTMTEIKDDIIGILTKDYEQFGFDESQTNDAIKNFKKDPLSYLDPRFFHHIVDRIRLQQDIDELNDVNAQYEDEIKRLKEELKNKPEQVTKRLNRVKNSPHLVDRSPLEDSSAPTYNPAVALYG
jgi:hypothetical protein